VDFVLYDFGAMSVAYRIPIRAGWPELMRLSIDLYDNQPLLAESRRGLERLLATIGDAVAKPRIHQLVEDYVIYQIDTLSSAGSPRVELEHAGALVAQMLRAEDNPLSREESEDALACRISYGHEDVTIIDWNAAIIVGDGAEPIRVVLEYANVELLEMRCLDDQLDDALGQSYGAFSRRKWDRLATLGSRAAELRKVAEMQLDSALLFEGVNNALKLLGDQFLARVYRLAAQRLHLEAWDANIIRKLSTLDSIYDKLSNEQTSRRMEVLEWIIIILIAISIVVSFI
jgi:hypothetical protein